MYHSYAKEELDGKEPMPMEVFKERKKVNNELSKAQLDDDMNEKNGWHQIDGVKHHMLDIMELKELRSISIYLPLSYYI